jgi:prophage regulatory protein
VNKNSISNFDSLPDDAFIRLKELLELNVIPFSATTIWRKIKARTFPQPEKVSSNIVAWRCRSIREWLQNPASYMAEP